MNTNSLNPIVSPFENTSRKSIFCCLPFYRIGLWSGLGRSDLSMAVKMSQRLDCATLGDVCSSTIKMLLKYSDGDVRCNRVTKELAFLTNCVS